MTFREGLLQARGQLAFITAIAISTGIIIYLETLDTEQRIQSRIAAEVARQRSAPSPVPPSIAAAVQASLARSEADYAADPIAAANRAMILMSLSTAAQLGIEGPDAGLSRARRVLDDMAAQPGESSPALTSALGAAAAAFPTLQERIARLMQTS